MGVRDGGARCGNSLLLDAIPCVGEQTTIGFELGQRGIPLSLPSIGQGSEPVLGLIGSGMRHINERVRTNGRLRLGAWCRPLPGKL